MNDFFSDKVALVTGSSKRTGKEIALELAKHGIETIIHYNNSYEDAQATVEEIKSFGGKAYCLQADISQSLSAADLIESVLKRSGKIDILINNVGQFLVKNIEELNPSEWDSIIQNTINCTFYMCHFAIPHMVTKEYARIINIGDSGADYIKPWTHVTPYMIGKTGILTLTKSLAEFYAASQLTINCIAPGVLENSYGQKPEMAKRFGTCDDINNAIIFLLKEESSYITGANLKISGGWCL